MTQIGEIGKTTAATSQQLITLQAQIASLMNAVNKIVEQLAAGGAAKGGKKNAKEKDGLPTNARLYVRDLAMSGDAAVIAMLEKALKGTSEAAKKAAKSFASKVESPAKLKTENNKMYCSQLALCGWGALTDEVKKQYAARLQELKKGKAAGTKGAQLAADGGEEEEEEAEDGEEGEEAEDAEDGLEE